MGILGQICRSRGKNGNRFGGLGQSWGSLGLIWGCGADSRDFMADLGGLEVDFGVQEQILGSLGQIWGCRAPPSIPLMWRSQQFEAPALEICPRPGGAAFPRPELRALGAKIKHFYAMGEKFRFLGPSGRFLPAPRSPGPAPPGTFRHIPAHSGSSRLIPRSRGAPGGGGGGGGG